MAHRDPGLLHRDRGQPRRADQIAGGAHAMGGGRVALVDAHPASGIGLGPGVGEPEVAGARSPPGGEKDLLGHQRTAVRELCFEPPVPSLDADLRRSAFLDP